MNIELEKDSETELFLRVEHVKSMPVGKIMDMIDRITQCLSVIDMPSTKLTIAQWRALDNALEMLKRFKP